MKKCHNCGAPWVSEKKMPGVKEYCEQCNAYLHCCKNCRFHNPSKHNQCKIPNADWVGDRVKANFCDDFDFKESAGDGDAPEKAGAARDAFGQLFGEEDVTDTRPKSLDDIFGD